MSLRSPLGRVRGLGSAKSGTQHWWAQRLTALALVPLTVWFVIAMIVATGSDQVGARAFIGDPVSAVLLVLLIAIAFHHAQSGLQVVIEDYVHSKPAELVLLLVVKAAAVILALAAIFAVLSIAFGGA